MNKSIVAFLPLLIASGACGGSLYRTKPKDPVVNRAVTTLWAKDIRAIAKTGDWILSRSYSAIGDAIVIGTSGEEISHSVIYDAERETIIEAIRSGVREVSLENFLERNRVAIVVRPDDTTEASRRESIARARSVVGNGFDFGGLLGVQTDNKFYCSELVVWASGVTANGLVVSPASLIKRGQVLYLSGNRDDDQVQSAALARLQSSDVLRTAAR